MLKNTLRGNITVMMNKHFFVIVLLLNLFGLSSLNVFAMESFKFLVNTKVERSDMNALKNKNPEIMANYHPDNFVIENLYVKDNIIRYTSVKKFLFFTYRIKHDSELFYDENFKCKNPSEQGYQVTMDLTKSESIISNNVSKILMNICYHYIENDTKTEINADVDIVKGPNVSTFFGGIIFKIVYRQTLPIFKAVNLTLEQMHDKSFSGTVISAPVIELPDSASTASSTTTSK